ncbi:MAG: major capsid protein [Acidovorax sp.]|uniref:major capsid protein n=1 Tax=Acidovorax sp. TaxID=1872122 RepID=UPI0039E29853
MMTKISKIAAVPALALASVMNAHAELPASVATTISEYKDDSLEALGLIIAAGIAIWGLRKLGQRFGWI